MVQNASNQKVQRKQNGEDKEGSCYLTFMEWAAHFVYEVVNS